MVMVTCYHTTINLIEMDYVREFHVYSVDSPPSLNRAHLNDISKRDGICNARHDSMTGPYEVTCLLFAMHAILIIFIFPFHFTLNTVFSDTLWLYGVSPVNTKS